MSERDGFLEAIRRDDGDAPRLIYADWLDDHNELDRAEFIRLGCELARLPRTAPERGPVQDRYIELHHAHAGRWLEPLGLGENQFFDRGVVTHVRYSPSDFARFAEAAFRCEPVSRLTLDVWSDETLDRWTASPGLEHLTRLGVQLDQPQPQGLRESAHSPRLANVRRLELEPGEFWTPGTWEVHLAALAGSPMVGRLHRFDLRNAPVWAWIDVFGALDAGFARLGLVNCGLDPASVARLADSAMLSGVAELDLSQNALGRAGVAALLESRHSGKVERLSLAGGWRPGEGNPSWGQLVEPNIGEQGVFIMADSPRAARLRRLDLRANHVGRRAVAALIASPHLDSLEELILGESWVMERGDGLDDPSIGEEDCRRLRDKFGERVRFV